jgi:acyl-CoA-dependent ceramide synthase
VDIRGDTSAPAMSTMNEVSPIEPTSPDVKVRATLFQTWSRAHHAD